MAVSERLRRFIRATAVGALIAFDASIVLVILAIAISFYLHDPLMWIPFALVALALVLLALAAGIGGALGAIKSQRGWWSTSFRVLVALSVVTPIVLAVSKNSLEQWILFPTVGLIYLVLPALALLFIGGRADLRLLPIGACVAYGAALVSIVLTFLFPDLGMDPTVSYFLYLPPQAFVAAMMLIAAMLLGMAGGIICAIDGRLSSRRWWSDGLLLAVAVGLLMPLLLAMQVHYPPLVSLSTSLEVVLYVAAGATYLALPVMALVYLRGSSHSASLRHSPGWSEDIRPMH